MMEARKVQKLQLDEIHSKIFFSCIDLVLNAQLKRYKRFLAAHKQALRRIEDTLGTNITQTWDFDLNPVELKVRNDFVNS